MPAAGQDVLDRHGLHGRVILREHALPAAAAFGYIALHAPSEALRLIRFDKDFHNRPGTNNIVVERQNPFNNDNFARLNHTSLFGTCVLIEEIHRNVHGLSAGERLQMGVQ